MILHPLLPRSTQLKTGSNNDLKITTCPILPKFYYACNITVRTNSWHCLHIDPLVIEEVFDWLRFKITLIKQLPLFYFVAFHFFNVSKKLKLMFVLSRQERHNWIYDVLAVLILLNCIVDAIHPALYKAKPPGGSKYFFHWLTLFKIYFSSISYIMHYTRILNS
jgi:hypothetical protein